MRFFLSIFLMFAWTAFGDGFLCVTNGTTVIGAGGGSGSGGYVCRTNGVTVIGVGGGSGSAGDGVLAVTNGVTVIGPGPLNSDPFSSILHAWHLQESAGNTRVDSVGSLSFTEVSGTVSSVTGVHGNAAQCGASNLETDPWVEPSSFTISLWIKIPVVSDVTTIINKNPDATEFNITCGDDGAGGIANVQFDSDNFVQKDISIAANTWFFVVVTYSGGVGQLSVNGSTFVSASMTVIPDSTALAIWDTQNNATIDVDELYFYNTVLTQGNATALYNSGSGTFYSP